MNSCANANLAGALSVSGDLSGRAAELLPGAQTYGTTALWSPWWIL